MTDSAGETLAAAMAHIGHNTPWRAADASGGDIYKKMKAGSGQQKGASLSELQAFGGQTQ